ncbi:MAG TPA: hypothetical protein VMT85_15125 [Thermoanaerobaculia bacterium]|nr:hypothetical protein [Thermoanaerobaculia bacterium]
MSSRPPRAVAERSAPTMIIPSGTSIQVDGHGQLSISTPGNLVLQNSGNYGTIESRQGSIRIEPDVQVEAVNVRCAKVCYIQGSLTAWKVEAEAIELEEEARAHIILQEAQSLQIGSQARLVGNFSSEKELFLLFSRFAKQMRSLPFFDRDDSAEPAPAPSLGAQLPSRAPELAAATAASSGPVEDGETNGHRAAELPEDLFFAQILLERELERAGGGSSHRAALEECLDLLRSGDVAALGRRHPELFEQVLHPSDDFRRAAEMIGRHFA